MENINSPVESGQTKSKIRNRCAYQGPLGEVICNDRYFFAWKDGCLIGASKTLEEAMEALVWKERVKTK
jgi:hypothetical protein